MIVTVQNAIHPCVRVVRVRGDLDMLAVENLRTELASLTSLRDGTHVIVDLTGTTFIDSTGLGVLVGARSLIVGSGGVLRLVIDRDDLLRTIRISSLARLFEVHPTLDSTILDARSEGSSSR